MNDVLKTLAERYELSGESAEKLGLLAELSVSLEISGTAIKDVDEALSIHIADSLAGLEIQQVTDADSIVDVGSGVGFPGLVLALALPATKVTLVDSVRKKMEAAGRLARELELSNVECVWARIEEIAATGSPHRETFDVVTARALAPLTALVEYAAPLLKVEGTLVAWKGDPDAEELADAAAAEQEIGFATGQLMKTKPFAGSARRHFYVTTKTVATSDRFPRRSGVALRKPIKA